MSTTPSNPVRESARHRLLAPLLCAIGLLSPALSAFALSTDRDQPLDVRAQYNKSTFGGDNVTVFQGNVRMVQGSLKASGDEARIWELDTGNPDSNARRLVLTGSPARLEQMMDNDGGRMTASAGTIDYRSDSGLAELSGNVIVIQEGRSEFRGPHMTYNTNTGAMEGGSQAPGSEVHMTFKPKPRSTAKPETDANP